MAYECVTHSANASANRNNLRQHPREVISWTECALTAARLLKDRPYEGGHLGNLGLAYANLGETSRAIECYEQQLVIDKETDDRLVEGSALSNLGNAYTEMGEASRAVYFCER